MRIALLVSTLLWGAVTQLSAQIEARTIVEFDKDQSKLRPYEAAKLDTFISHLLWSKILYVEITGHTDSDASNAYNEQLALRRANQVAKAFQQLELPDSVMRITGKGEDAPIADNDSEEGMRHNRRVEIVVMHRLTPPDRPCGGFDPPKCNEDTTIILPEGTMYIINKCLYLANPDCVKITEIYHVDAMIVNDMRTMTHGHEPLISGGMLKYDICDTLQVEVFMPVREGCDGEDMSFWEQDEKGNWVEVDNRPITPVTVNGRRYFPIRLSGSGSYNLDKRRPVLPGPPPPKTRFKVKWREDVRLQSVTVYCDCPLSAIMVPAKNKRERKIVINSTCCPDAMVTFEASDKSGKKLRFDYQPVKDLKEASSLGQCRTDKRREWWFFRTWNKTMYRKYKIRRSDFKN